MNAQDCTLEAMDIILSLYKDILPIHGEFRYIGCPSSDSPKGVYMRFISKYFISLEYLQRHSTIFCYLNAHVILRDLSQSNLPPKVKCPGDKIFRSKLPQCAPAWLSHCIIILQCFGWFEDDPFRRRSRDF